MDHFPAPPYLLLTPGPLTTTPRVKAAMFRDFCTWDEDYNTIVQEIRTRLVALAVADAEAAKEFTAVPMQGSGTFCVEAALTSFVPRDGKLLVLANGAYGRRMAQIAQVAAIPHTLLDFGDTAPPDPAQVEAALNADPTHTHLAMVHCETTTGMLNPVAPMARLARKRGIPFILDAMSSFGGIPLDMDREGIDILISSANKCIQGVPGFGFVLARRALLKECQGRARSLSLDLFDQWKTMEQGKGKWRFTSPTHVVRAFAQALEELETEGGIPARHRRYTQSQHRLSAHMTRLGFVPLLSKEHQSPVITSFLFPDHPDFDFRRFYQALKARGFVIYPGKVTARDTFRIGNIGDVHPADMDRLAEAVHGTMDWNS